MSQAVSSNIAQFLLIDSLSEGEQRKALKKLNTKVNARIRRELKKILSDDLYKELCEIMKKKDDNAIQTFAEEHIPDYGHLMQKASLTEITNFFDRD